LPQRKKRGKESKGGEKEKRGVLTKEKGATDCRRGKKKTIDHGRGG